MIVISLSGGKDSTAMILALALHYGAENVIAHYQALAEDWPETLDYCRALCAQFGVRFIAQQILYQPVGDDRAVRQLEIHDIHTSADIVPARTPGCISGVIDLAFRRRWPPSMGVRFCTSYFKERALDAWITRQQNGGLKLGRDVIVALGERAGESPRRARKPELVARFTRKAYTVWNWLPIHAWSRRETFRALRDHDIRPHPAYHYQGMADWQMYDLDDEGGPRTGCRFCIYNTHSDLCHQAQMESNHGLLGHIRQFEEATGRTWWMNRSTTDICEPQPMHAPARQLKLF